LSFRMKLHNNWSSLHTSCWASASSPYPSLTQHGASWASRQSCSAASCPQHLYPPILLSKSIFFFLLPYT
jgi:hypothetical protein